MDDEEYYEVPLRDQCYFGAGIKRKRIQFVPSSSGADSGSTSLPSGPKASAADKYLDIVLGRSRDTPAPATKSAVSPKREKSAGGHEYVAIDHEGQGTGDGVPVASEDLICDVCGRPVAIHEHGSAHESMLAHQLSLPHSHPPSNVDRTRKGLNVLQTQGWDPDSRLGLGAQGQGRRQPVKAVENPDRAGLGAKFAPAKVVEKPVKLDAGKLRLMEKEGKKNAAKLRNDFYAKDDVLKYLGEQEDGGVVDLNFGARRKGRRRK